jgi:thioredoxin
MSSSILSEGKHIIDFTATWCGPCKRIAPLFEKLKEENKEIQFHKVDVDEDTETTKHFEIESMPTFVAVMDGKEVERFSGASESKLKEMLEMLLSL